MDPEAAILDALLQGPLGSASRPWPLTLHARLGDLRPRFIPKCQVGRGHRAIARNGHVLLASDAPLSDLTGKLVRIRLQTWHKAILPGERPEPYGILLAVRTVDEGDGPNVFAVGLAPHSTELRDLIVDVGGGLRLEFRSLAG